MRRLLKGITLALLAPAALHGAAAQTQPKPADPIRIGFICPFTGGSQDFGNSARLGAELAVKEINEVGGYLGRPVELLLRDDKADPEEGRKVARELVLKEKADFTVGFCNTGVALAALSLYQDYKHLLMVPVSTGSAVTARYPASSSYIFRMSARDTLQAAHLVEDVVRRGFTRVALFADNTGYGEGGFNDVTKFLADNGLRPAYKARFDIGVKTLTQQMIEARDAGAQAVIGYTVGPEAAVMALSRVEAKFSGPLYGPWPLSFRTVWEKAGPAADGAIMVQTIIQDISSERRASFIVRLKRYAGKQPIGSLMAAAQSYDAVHLMMRAVFQTKGDLSSDALKRALEDLQQPYFGVVTTHEKPFSPQDHDAFTRNMIWLGVWRRGEVQFLYPEDAQRASFIRRKASQR